MTDDDRALLDFAAKWWQAAGNQHDAITADPGEDLLVAVLSPAIVSWSSGRAAG